MTAHQRLIAELRTFGDTYPPAGLNTRRNLADILKDAADFIESKTQPSEEEERKRGEILVSMLNLKPIKPAEPGSDCPRYRTEWGSKTALGLFRTLRGIIEGELPR
jgi:hypothetical protein